MAVEGPALSDIERLRRLQAVTDAALAHLSVDELLSELLDRIRSALEADTCAFLLLDPDRNELVARAAKGTRKRSSKESASPSARDSPDASLPSAAPWPWTTSIMPTSSTPSSANEESNRCSALR